MKKVTALVLIGTVYILSFSAGFLFSYFMRDYLNIYVNLFIATIISTILIFIFNLICKNASVYDPYWSIQPLFLIGIYYVIYKEYSFNPVHLLILIPVFIWAIRLTYNWVISFKDFSWEDWRYRMLKEKTDNKILKELLILTGVMIFPTVVVYFTTLPLFNSFMSMGSNQILLYIIGGTVVLLGTLLEIISDYQMHSFKLKKLETNIDSGLWKYSRHPNYLGELLIWTGVFIAALNIFSWINIIGIILVYLLFIFISIPMAERRYLQKYPDYSVYKKRTSMLMILPKRKI